MKKRDRGQTAVGERSEQTAEADEVGTSTNTSLVVGLDEAVHREGMELKADTASAFYLDGEGTSKNSKESMDIARVIPNNNSEIIKNLNTKKISKIEKRFSYRVPVLYPDGKPGIILRQI